MSKGKRYRSIIERVFFSKRDEIGSDAIELPFTSKELSSAHVRSAVNRVINNADPTYNARNRATLPQSILNTQPEGKQWIILGRGKGKYAFVLTSGPIIITPTPGKSRIKVPDSTPEIVVKNALADEQALLAKVRYNRLLDMFLCCTTYLLQSHCRTSVSDIGQFEIDELHIGIDRHGRQFIIPVQAKVKDKHSCVSTLQDIAFSRDKFKKFRCRPISVQFADKKSNVVAIFELAEESQYSIKILEETHYHLAPLSEIGEHELERYNRLQRRI